LGALVLKNLGDLSRGGARVGSQVASSSTANVGSGHRSTRDGVGGGRVADPSRLHAGARGEDVHAVTPVGVRRANISALGSSDSDGRLNVGRGVEAGISIAVTGGDNHNNSELNSGVNGIIDGLALGASERHVGNRWAATGDLLVGSPADTSNYTIVRSRASAVQYLDGNDVRLLGNTVGSTSNSTSAVGTVTIAVAVISIVSEGCTPLNAASELGVVT